jgi:hypothetical protein
VSVILEIEVNPFHTKGGDSMNSFEARLFWLGPYVQEGLRETSHSYLIIALSSIVLVATGLFLFFRIGDKHRKKNVPR